MKFFTKNEFIAVFSILSAVVIVSLFNFKIALRRARDTQRRDDLGAIYNAIEKYQLEFGFFPLSTDSGKIKACKPDNYDQIIAELSLLPKFDLEAYLSQLKDCEWGQDGIFDISDETQPPYIKTLPVDPKFDEQISYFYISNSRLFQIYAYLEGEEDEVGYNQAIVNRKIACGEKTCNFGRAYANTPLDKSLAEYENELMEEKSK